MMESQGACSPFLLAPLNAPLNNHIGRMTLAEKSFSPDTAPSVQQG
jgi:hypothetical protein